MENICICILNYNNGKATVNCLESIARQSYKNFRVAIVDNCSTDDSVDVITRCINGGNIAFRDASIRAKFVIIKAPENKGYSAGNNTGIRYAKEAGVFSQVLILNNDTELREDFLDSMVGKYKSENKKHGSARIAIGSVETDMEGRIRNKGFHYLNIPSGLAFNFPLFPCLRYIVGSCIFLPVDTPLLDERYFLYFDDAAFAKILKKENFYLASLSASGYKHESGSTIKKEPNLHRINFKSMKVFYMDHYPILFPMVVILRFLLNVLMCRPKIAADLLKISLSSGKP